MDPRENFSRKCCSKCKRWIRDETTTAETEESIPCSGVVFDPASDGVCKNCNKYLASHMENYCDYDLCHICCHELGWWNRQKLQIRMCHGCKTVYAARNESEADKPEANTVERVAKRARHQQPAIYTNHERHQSAHQPPRCAIWQKLQTVQCFRKSSSKELSQELFAALEICFGQPNAVHMRDAWFGFHPFQGSSRIPTSSGDGKPPGYNDLGEKLKGYVDKMLSAYKSGPIMGMEEPLERLTSEGWVHANAYLALALCKNQADAADVRKFLQAYGSMLREDSEWDSVALLAAVRACEIQGWSTKNAQILFAFYVSTFARQAEYFATKEDYSIFDEAYNAPASLVKSPSSIVEAEWQCLRSELKTCLSMEHLMQMVGLESVKKEAIRLLKKIKSDQALTEKQRVPCRLNFTFMGNPGTGKTSVARLFGRIMHEAGARSSNSFVETTGQQLVQDGAMKMDKLLAAAMGGVLFIDEAHSLDPRRNAAEGPGIVTKLLKAAEDDRDKLSIILAGYQDDIEGRLYAADQGFKSRFHDVLFEDFSEDELRRLFLAAVAEREWSLDSESPRLAEVVARRLVRGRGVKGFANARTVRELFERGCAGACERGGAPVLRAEDLIGERPDRQKNLGLRDALNDLQSLVGLTEMDSRRKGAGQAVKDAVERLIKTVEANYDRELRGEPTHTLALNRLFLGNPGTGKTTVAEIYGRILKHLNLLSVGSVVVKAAGDFIVGHEGGTEEKTLAIIEAARGKVLVIDEAYILGENSYGSIALNMLVSKVMGSPGEDIAVLLLGYEQKMLRMLREKNPGLAGRFNPENAFFFPDYTDCELKEIIMRAAKREGLEVSFPVRQAAVKLLAQERLKPNFRNAGAVNNLLCRAKERMATRNPLSRALVVEDLGVSSEQAGADGNPLKELMGMYRIEPVIEAMREIRAVAEEKRKSGQHMEVGNYLFLGNPGTGKTTVARVMGKMMSSLGLLADKPPVEITAGEIQACYVGQSAEKARALLEEARGGVLFVDEAHDLSHSPFSREAAKVLMTGILEDGHRGRTMLIFAGYPDETEDMIRSVDPGMRRRFKGTIPFADWSAQDCTEFVRRRCGSESILLDSTAEAHVLQQLAIIRTRPGWGNASDAVDTFEYLFAGRALRVSNGEIEATANFTLSDAKWAMDRFLRQRPPDREPQQNQAPHSPRALETSSDQHLPQTTSHSRSLSITSNVPPPSDVTAKEMQVCDGDATIFAALEAACVELGYDKDHASRKRLLELLKAVRDGGPFPEDMVELVQQKTGRSAAVVDRLLRPQLPSFSNSVDAMVMEEEERLDEQRRLEQERQRADEEARRAADEKERELAEQHRREIEARMKTAEAERKRREQAQQKLRCMGLCPAGFSWFRQGLGWKCMGGSHYVPDSQFPW